MNFKNTKIRYKCGKKSNNLAILSPWFNHLRILFSKKNQVPLHQNTIFFCNIWMLRNFVEKNYCENFESWRYLCTRDVRKTRKYRENDSMTKDFENFSKSRYLKEYYANSWCLPNIKSTPAWFIQRLPFKNPPYYNPRSHSPFNQCTTIPLVVCYIESQKKKYYLPVDLSVLFLQDNNSRLPPYNCSYTISLRKKSKKYATYQAQIWLCPPFKLCRS